MKCFDQVRAIQYQVPDLYMCNLKIVLRVVLLTGHRPRCRRRHTL